MTVEPRFGISKTTHNQYTVTNFNIVVMSELYTLKKINCRSTWNSGPSYTKNKNYMSEKTDSDGCPPVQG